MDCGGLPPLSAAQPAARFPVSTELAAAVKFDRIATARWPDLTHIAKFLAVLLYVHSRS